MTYMQALAQNARSYMRTETVHITMDDVEPLARELQEAYSGLETSRLGHFIDQISEGHGTFFGHHLKVVA